MYTYNATILRVIDGDTVDASIDLGFNISHKIRIRLLGIDTPETRTRDLEEKERGLQAKYRLVELLDSVENKCLVQTRSNKGKYGRWLGTLIIKDENNFDLNINQTLIDEGFASIWK